MRLSKSRCNGLHLGWGSPRLREEVTESSPAEKGLGVLVDENVGMTHQCVLTTQMANAILGCIKSSSKEGILLLCSALVRPHLKYRVQVWSPQLTEDMGPEEAI